MKRKLLALILSVSLVFSLAACGGEDASGEAVNNESSGDVSEESETSTNEDEASGDSKDKDANDSKKPGESADENTDETAGVGGDSDSEMSEEEVHEHAYAEELVTSPTCTSVGLKKFTCECGEFYEEGIDMLSHELGDYVYNNDATYEKDGTESASCKVCKNVVETRTKTGTMLVKAPEPEIPSIPAGNGPDTTIGSELAIDGTITSYNGATLNKLASFNMAGLYNCPEEYASNYEWFGYFNNDDPNNANTTQSIVGHALVTNLDNTMKAVGCQQGFSPWNDCIYFYFGTGGAAGDIELRRYPSKGYYTISINYDMSQGYGSVTANDGRDVLLAFCAMISSTPLELENIIYNDCFGDPSLLSYDYYTTIGDCQVKNYYGIENQTMVYAIKPN